MKTVYIDYNLIAIMAGRTRPDAEKLTAHVLQLVAHDYRVALSAWHALELSRSNRPEYIEACIDRVDRLQPLWMSNPTYVKVEELKGLLARQPSFSDFDSHPNPAFNSVISQMWATYGLAVVGETFRHTVLALHHQLAASNPIADAIARAPQAILIGREAVKDGRMTKCQPVIDREYFKFLVPRAGAEAIDYLMANMDDVLDACPAVAVEDCLTRIRVSESFKPQESDAADLQHATIGLAYCDYFVSDDKKLVEHCRRCATQSGVDCIVGKNLLDIPIR